MRNENTEFIKISARMPKDLIDRLSRSHPGENLSSLLRHLIEDELQREKIRKEHLKLYGRFKPEHFDESLL